MSTIHIVSLLIEERDKLNAAIQALQGESVYDDPTMPDWVKPAVKKAPAKKRGGMTAAGRKAIGEATRKRWAALRAAKEASAKVAPVAKTRPLVRVVPTIFRRTRKPMTAAQKKAHGARMKAFWAARRKQKG